MIMNGNFSTFERISEEPEYEGQWVVILDKKVVARGTSKEIKEEMETIRKEHPEEIPLIAKVSRKAMQIV
ncbi:MAG: DUF5678 domain-containing protein [Promethearchaeota archaeon]